MSGCRILYYVCKKPENDIITWTLSQNELTFICLLLWVLEKCMVLLLGMPKLLHRLQNITNPQWKKRSVVFASGLRIANGRCLYVYPEFQKHLAEDVIKSHSAFPNFLIEDILAVTFENMETVSRIPVAVMTDLSL